MKNKKNNTYNSVAVFLDVDGVINSLNHLYKNGDFNMSTPAKPYQAGKYQIWVPSYMGALIRAIHKSTNLYWLTTWREKANKYISPILGLPSDIPVITDGLNTRNVRWKAAACRPIAEQLTNQGKIVYWIEDFHGFKHHELVDVLTPIDTDTFGEGVLLPQHLPWELSLLINDAGYMGPARVELPFTTGSTPIGI